MPFCCLKRSGTISGVITISTVKENVKRAEWKKRAAVLILAVLTVIMFFVCLLAGSSGMSAGECLEALFGKGSAASVRIMRNIRLPRVLAAVTAGAGLSLSGLIMQTTLNNPMASPSTLGVSNASVFGANLSMIVFADGFLTTGNNLQNYTSGIEPYSTSVFAFIFAALSILLILGLCRVRAYSPNVVALAGIAAGSVWTAAATILQFYATDVGLSAAVVWSFGDLGRATFRTDFIMLVAVTLGAVFFALTARRCNALLSGDDAAKGMGVNTSALRFSLLLAASLITAVCVSFLGVIGFVGMICPHIAKKLLGQDHRFSIPASALSGSLLLLTADTLSRSVGKGSALPVGAITSFLGVPFFLAVILSKKDG